MFVTIRPDLQVDDAIKSAVIILRIDRLAVIDHRENAVVIRQALKGDVVSLIREVLCDWQTTKNITEPKMIND
jgi:hypothetical protein